MGRTIVQLLRLQSTEARLMSPHARAKARRRRAHPQSTLLTGHYTHTFDSMSCRWCRRLAPRVEKPHQAAAWLTCTARAGPPRARSGTMHRRRLGMELRAAFAKTNPCSAHHSQLNCKSQKVAAAKYRAAHST